MSDTFSLWVKSEAFDWTSLVHRSLCDALLEDDFQCYMNVKVFLPCLIPPHLYIITCNLYL